MRSAAQRIVHFLLGNAETITTWWGGDGVKMPAEKSIQIVNWYKSGISTALRRIISNSSLEIIFFRTDIHA